MIKKIQLILSLALCAILLLSYTSCAADLSGSLYSSDIDSSSHSDISSSSAISSESEPRAVHLPYDEPFDSPSNWQEPKPIALIRGWHADNMMAAGYKDRYLFLENGVFFYTQNQMIKNTSTVYSDGEWTYENGVVYLTVMRKVVVEGGEWVDIPNNPSQQMLEGGTYAKIELSPNMHEHIKLSVTIEQLTEEETKYFDASIKLGSEIFWASTVFGFDDMLVYWDIVRDGNPV